METAFLKKGTDLFLTAEDAEEVSFDHKLFTIRLIPSLSRAMLKLISRIRGHGSGVLNCAHAYLDAVFSMKNLINGIRR